jgi:hypothetical protein
MVSLIVRHGNHFALGFQRSGAGFMSASVPEVTFTPRASGDGTWFVEVESPGLAYEDVGDFRSRESAEAWIRDVLRGQGASDSPTLQANAEPVDGDAAAEQQPVCSD